MDYCQRDEAGGGGSSCCSGHTGTCVRVSGCGRLCICGLDRFLHAFTHTHAHVLCLDRAFSMYCLSFAKATQNVMEASLVSNVPVRLWCLFLVQPTVCVEQASLHSLYCFCDHFCMDALLLLCVTVTEQEKAACSHRMIRTLPTLRPYPRPHTNSVWAAFPLMASRMTLGLLVVALCGALVRVCPRGGSPLPPPNPSLLETTTRPPMIVCSPRWRQAPPLTRRAPLIPSARV